MTRSWLLGAALAVPLGLPAGASAQTTGTASDAAFAAVPVSFGSALTQGLYREAFINSQMQLLRRADVGHDGLDEQDIVIPEQKAVAAARAALVTRALALDLNGDGQVTTDEARTAFTFTGAGAATPDTVNRQVAEVMSGDANHDGVLTGPEILAMQPAAAAPRTVPSPIRVLWQLDPNHDGRLTADELEAILNAAWAAVDTDGDSYLSPVEAAAFASYKQRAAVAAAAAASAAARAAGTGASGTAPAGGVSVGAGTTANPVVRPLPGNTRACNLPKPGANDMIAVFGVYEGQAVSSVAVAGLDVETSAAQVVVEQGKQPLYLVLSSYDAMVWVLQGATDRVARVVLLSQTRAPDGTAGAGVSGIAAERVSFVNPGDCFNSFYDPNAFDSVVAKGVLTTALGKAPDVFTGSYGLGSVGLPSAEVLHPPLDTKAPVGLDPQMWQESLRFQPAGLMTLDAKSVVSPFMPVAYDVLPQQAGLAQLVASGALVRLSGSGDAFRIVKPIPRYPAGLTGAHLARFILAAGVPQPAGNPGHSCVVAEATGQPISASVLCPLH